jgi:hypothetical protein
MSGWAVRVDGTALTQSFVITGISAGYQGVPKAYPVIWVSNVSGTTISDISANK